MFALTEAGRTVDVPLNAFFVVLVATPTPEKAMGQNCVVKNNKNMSGILCQIILACANWDGIVSVSLEELSACQKSLLEKVLLY